MATLVQLMRRGAITGAAATSSNSTGSVPAARGVGAIGAGCSIANEEPHPNAITDVTIGARMATFQIVARTECDDTTLVAIAATRKATVL